MTVLLRTALGRADLRRLVCISLLGMLIVAGNQLGAAEINGQVREANESRVRISTDSELVPSVGDPVEIYFEVPGLDDPVEVGTGKVTAVTADSIEAKIDQIKAKVTKNQLVRISSSHPRKRSELMSPQNAPAQPRPGGGKANSPQPPEAHSTKMRELRHWKEESIVATAEFSTDGRYVLTCSDGVRYWDVVTG